MSGMYDVVVVGAGPVGLFLACELGMSHASVLVLERDVDPTASIWKSEKFGVRSLSTASAEILYRRGLLDDVFDPHWRPKSFERTSGFQLRNHYAGLFLDANKIDLDRWRYLFNGPALLPGRTSVERVETALTKRAKGLGVEILRGHSVATIDTSESSSVAVITDSGELFRSKWLVGCDGGRSTIRKASGFSFEGTLPLFTGYAMRCDFNKPSPYPFGFNFTSTGMYIAGFSDVVYLTDFDGGAHDRKEELSVEYLQGLLDRITGRTDVKIEKIHASSTFTDRAMQATTYRRGRVILAGDAAHIHGPVGGQGMNTGLGDAMNLGWKLAATIRKDKESTPQPASGLLDTYEAERRAIGAEVLEWTRAQALIMQPSAHSAAMRDLLQDLMNTSDGANMLIDRSWGLSQRTALRDVDMSKHPLLGRSAPEFEFLDGSRLGEKLLKGKAIVVDFTKNSALADATRRHRAGVDYIDAECVDTRAVAAILVRPDGIVAWAADEGETPEVESAEALMAQWY